jgi:hypothetical protein
MASEPADEPDSSVRHVTAHLSDPEAVALVEVVEACDSASGREMDVSAVAAERRSSCSIGPTRTRCWGGPSAG